MVTGRANIDLASRITLEQEPDSSGSYWKSRVAVEDDRTKPDVVTGSFLFRTSYSDRDQVCRIRSALVGMRDGTERSPGRVVQGHLMGPAIVVLHGKKVNRVGMNGNTARIPSAIHLERHAHGSALGDQLRVDVIGAS